MVLQGIDLDRCWDIAEAHRILRGGRDGDPALAWATVCGLVISNLPEGAGDNLFDFATKHGSGDRGDPESPERSPQPGRANPHTQPRAPSVRCCGLLHQRR